MVNAPPPVPPSAAHLAAGAQFFCASCNAQSETAAPCGQCGQAVQPIWAPLAAGDIEDYLRWRAHLVIALPLSLVNLGADLWGEGRFHYGQLVLSLIILAWPGRLLLQGAWLSLAQKRLSGPVLVAALSMLVLAWRLVVAILGGVTETPTQALLGSSDFVVTMGLAVYTWNARGSAELAHLLRASWASLPLVAMKVSGGETKEVAAHVLCPGDEISVEAGTVVPADGVIINGQSVLVEPSLFGAVSSVERLMGAEVFAGWLNQTAAIVVRVSRPTHAGLMVRALAALARAPRQAISLQATLDPAQRWLLVLAVVGAALVLAGGLSLGAGPQVGFGGAVCALVMLCPLGLDLVARGLLLRVGLAALRKGALIPDPRTLELLARTRTLVLEHAGALVANQGTLARIDTLGDRTEDELLAYAAAAGSGVGHGFAAVLAEAAKERGQGEQLSMSSPDYWPGEGVCATVEGVEVAVGNRKLMHALGIDSLAAVPLAEERRREGLSVTFVAFAGEIVGLFGFALEPRPGAQDAAARLRTSGVRTVLLSSDAGSTANTLALRLGLWGAVAEVVPEEHWTVVEQHQLGGKRLVAVLGGGGTNRTAVAHADLHVACTDSSMDAEVISWDGLAGVASAFEVAHDTAQGLRWARNVSLGVSLGGVSVFVAAVIGRVGVAPAPLVAAALMAVAAAAVVTASGLPLIWRTPLRS